MNIKYILLPILIIFSLSSAAGTADLNLEMTIVGIENGVKTGQQGSYSLTVTNNGPDIAAEGVENAPISVISSPVPLVDGGPAIDILPDPNDDPRCGFAVAMSEPTPFSPARFGFFVWLPSLEIGESIKCSGFYLINLNSGSQEVSWSLSNPFDTDPDLSNNSQTFVFGIEPVRVPTLSMFASLMLIGMLLIFAKNHLYK